MPAASGVLAHWQLASLHYVMVSRNKLVLAGFASMLHFAYSIGLVANFEDKLRMASNVFVTTVYRRGHDRHRFMFFYFNIKGLSPQKSTVTVPELRTRICCFSNVSMDERRSPDVWSQLGKVSRCIGPHWQDMSVPVLSDPGEPE